MLVGLIVASLFAASPSPSVDADTRALLKAAFAGHVPGDSKDDDEWLAATEVDECHDGTQLLVVVTADGKQGTDDAVVMSANVYSLRKSGARWKVIDKLELAAPDRPDEPVELKTEAFDLGGGVRGTSVRFLGEDPDTKSSRAEGTLFVVLPSGKFGEPFKCNSDKDCEFWGTGHVVQVSQDDTGDGDDPTQSSEETYGWDGAHFFPESEAEAQASEPLIASATASSTLVEKGLPKDYYVPAKAFDQAEKSAWAEGVPGPGVGQWIEFKLSRPAKVTKLHLLAGCGATPARRGLNERLKTLKVTGDGADAQVVSLRDVTVEQQVSVKFSKPISKLRLEIQAVYPGTKFQDACLSELSLDEE